MLTTLVLAVAVPVAIGVAFTALGHILGLGSPSGGRGRWAAALAPALALGAAYAVVKSWPSFPPLDATAWIVWGALFTAVLAGAQAQLTWPAALRWAFRALASAGLPWLVLRPLVDHAWTGTEAALWLGGAALALIALWTGLERGFSRTPGPFMPLAVALLGTATAMTLGLSGTALLAQVTGGLTACFGVLAAYGLWKRSMSLAHAASPVVTVSLGGVLLAGVHYAEVPLASAGLLILAGILPAAVAGLAWARVSVWRGLATYALSVLLLAGPAVAIAHFGGTDEGGPATGTTGGSGAGTADDSDYDKDYGYD